MERPALPVHGGGLAAHHGGGHTIQPAVTGLNEQGLVNGDATALASIIRNSGTLTMTGVSPERAHLTSFYGAGLYNASSANAL